MKKIMIFTIITLALALATSACDDKPEDPPREITVTINGVTTRVAVDASVSNADWDSVKGKVAQAMSTINDSFNDFPSHVQTGLDNMMGNGIRVINGSEVPAADDNGALVMSVGWLESKEPNTITGTIVSLANQGKFNVANAKAPSAADAIITFSAPKGV